tara:strand:- start:208 stop:633 length:426 start_codon:yes stop_codon:yes gene_type:complete
MICYSLKCTNGHTFDSWFGNVKAYEKLKASGLLSCSICGDPNVQKAIMSPSVTMKTKAPKRESPLRKPASAAEQALNDLRQHIEKTSENVGSNFAEEARAIHNGEAPERTIHGKTNLKEAKSLNEEGIPVIPLPWSERKSN